MDFAMEIYGWLDDRSKSGTLAGMARRIASDGRRYKDIQKRLRALYVLEHLVRAEGNQTKVAEVLGISRTTIHQALRQLDIRRSDIRELARAIKEETHGNG